MKLHVEDDAVARGARAHHFGNDFRWPGGRRVAVVLNLAYEAWSDSVAPGLGPMGNPLPAGTFDTNALSWGHYGERRGIARLLRVLDRAGMRASVMVSGILAARAPDMVRAIAQAGHEIVAHCYAQDIIPARLSAQEVEADIVRTTTALADVSAIRPVGWISPRGTPHADSARLLLAAGYRWQGDVFDADRPYVQEFAGGSLVAVPLTMEINDLPHAMRFGRSPRQFVELFDDALVRALADEEASMIDVTAHAHCYGRPAGAAAFAEIAMKLRQRDDIWVTTRAEIAAHAVGVFTESRRADGAMNVNA